LNFILKGNPMKRKLRSISALLIIAAGILTIGLSPATAQESPKAVNPEVTGSGTADFIAIWKSATALGNSGLFQTGGEVGLGTTTPKAVLDVETANTAGTPAIQGQSKATSGTAYGILGIVNSAATASGTLAVGVAGTSNATSGNTSGVLGTDYNPSGTAGFFQAVSTTSVGQRGVEGIAYGPGGIGVRGDATGNASNLSFGLEGVVTGPIDIGISAFATSTTGDTAGIAAYDYSATGTAGIFNNIAGGNLLVGQNNGINKFRVDGTGRGYFDGGVQASGADFAESVAVRGNRGGYQPGDLLAIDPTGNRRLDLSQEAYSTRVAGIYSTKPGILASTGAMDEARLAGEVPLAVVGIVPCKVTAENGAIGVGDLLVAASRAGYAMKGTDRSRMLGAVVGKAMEPLTQGNGVIQVLVTLQ
jgi:hypothetical protein